MEITKTVHYVLKLTEKELIYLKSATSGAFYREASAVGTFKASLIDAIDHHLNAIANNT
jgi:hypothetical protein